MSARRPTTALRQRGFTLIELLVAVTIGLILTLAVTSVVTLGEAHKRTTTATNDMNQSGNYAAYVIDRAVRSAGSGFAQSWNYGVFGCQLSVARSGTQLLPRAAAFAAPFAAVPQTLTVAPVLIQRPAAGSDVLIVMSGNAATGDIGRPLLAGSVEATLALDNTVGLSNGDLALVSRNGIAGCVIEEVSSATADLRTAGNVSLTLGGKYSAHAASGLSDLASSLAGPDSYLSPLGREASNNAQFQMFGVGANRTLVSYDLLQSAGTGKDTEAMQGIADGVVEMHALYGLMKKDGSFDKWVAPTGDYALATMMATPEKVRTVGAVRLAMVLRSTDYTKEKEDAGGNKVNVASSNLTLFGDLEDTTLHLTVAPVDADDQHFRRRVVELTIPLRNMLLLPPMP